MPASTASPAFPDPIPGVIPFGSICTLAGATGVGKTALTATWIKRWLDGRSICWHPTNCPTAIGIIAGDRRWRSHRQWFDVAECPELLHYSLRDDDNFPWNDLRLWLRVKDVTNRALDRLKLPPGGLVILDPLALFLPGKVNEYKDVAIGLGVLDQLIKPRQLTAFGLFHQAKQMNDRTQRYSRPQDRILGSAAQLGFSDTAMYLLAPEDLGTAYYGFGWVPHNSPPATFEFTKDDSGLFVPYRGVVDTSPDSSKDRPTQLLTLLPETLSISTSDLFDLAKAQFSVSRATFNRDLKTLADHQLVAKDSWGKWTRRKAN